MMVCPITQGDHNYITNTVPILLSQWPPGMPCLRGLVYTTISVSFTLESVYYCSALVNSN